MTVPTIIRLPVVGREAAVDRLRTFLRTVAPRSVPAGDDALPGLAARALADDDPRRVWLLLAVLRARFPTQPEVEAALRRVRLAGPADLVEAELGLLRRTSEVGLPSTRYPVSVVEGAVLVDVHHTSRAEYVSGIQRVVLETVPHWRADHDPDFVAWTEGYEALRPLTADESEQVFGDHASAGAPGVTLIPWGGAYLAPELTAEPERSQRLLALARYSGVRVLAIGYDCIPVTSGETAWTGMSSFFIGYLAMLRHAHRLTPISDGSAGEFRGWRRMVRAAGYPGPDIEAVTLPVHPRTPSPADEAAAAVRLLVPGHPMVLVVGSHEPRKNHLAVLQAAETLWREGLRFTLALAGTGSWGADRFSSRVAQLIAAGRPVELVTGLPDAELWAAYALARCVVFPSLNEGYGLPVAEALAAGTPVVTSDFGSMRDIVCEFGQPAGALMVDPRDDTDIADGLRRLLVDDDLHDRLSAEARARPARGWQQYARATWAYLVGSGETNETDPADR